jgi:hypothetical protein
MRTLEKNDGGRTKDEPPIGFNPFKNLLIGMALVSLAFSLDSIQVSTTLNIFNPFSLDYLIV